MNKKELNIQKLKVKSFITEVVDMGHSTVKGGSGHPNCVSANPLCRTTITPIIC